MAKKPRPSRAKIRPMTPKTIEQLKSTVWATEGAALADLRVSKIAPSGPDYELNETLSGWQLTAIEQDGREQRVIDSLRRKPGAKPKHEPEVIAHAKRPITAKSAKQAEREASASDKRIAKLDAKAPEKPVERVTLFADLEEAPEAAAPPAPPNPFAPLASDGDYEIVIMARDGSFPNNSVVAWAVNFSKRNKVRVHIRDVGGETRRSFNASDIKTLGRGRPMKDGSERSTGKSDRAAALFMRPGGATFDEVVSQVTEWGISERFVNRLARARNCKVEKLGEKEFRLIPQKS